MAAVSAASDCRNADAIGIAAAVRSGRICALALAQETLARIRETDAQLNAFTTITAARALARARAVDEAVASGRDPGPLAGVPFAAKDLFDVEGLPTLAGSAINRDRAPAARDATVVARLEAAGAVLIGTTNMDEYAYGFSTENSHYGATRNPHDPARVAGGSSGGSAAAVAARLVPITLGTDTNGSIRVPASFCGIWGLKPTFGRLPRTGAFPFVASLDHVGAFARAVPDLAAAYDAMQGPDCADPACCARAPQPLLAEIERGIDGLRIARAAGYFDDKAEPAVVEQVERAATALGARATVRIPHAEQGRAAAFVITAAEGGQLHLPNLRVRAADFEPLIVDRLMAGALIPAAWYLRAQRVRRWYYRKVMALFEAVDVILAPATPRPAQRIGEETFSIRGDAMLARPNAGLLTQPISCIGLPVVAAPVGTVEGMPVGMQIIAAPWREDLCLRAAAALERLGYCAWKGSPA
jgi:amidase/aspartyl-tRNA(Asn)/glutamyl-tRNA(Gln) amidotransferase subunit A